MQKMSVRYSVVVLSAAMALIAACGSDAVTTVRTPGSGQGVDLTAKDPGKAGILVTLSGEDLVSAGYGWTDASKAEGDPPAFVDGWALRFEHVLVTATHVRVNADPDKDSGNPTAVGALVASSDGPWAVDLVKGGDVVGKSGSTDEKATRLVSFTSKSDGSAFDPSARYAFGYDFVDASAAAKLVNFSGDAPALYTEAISKSWTVLYVGTATYKGPEPQASSVFASIPKVVKFKIGLHNPSTYANCRNTDLTQVGGEFPRGVQVSASRSTIAQITLHTDHMFWDALNVEGTPLHFDAIAAQANAAGEVTTDDLAVGDITALTTRFGAKLPWRSVVSDYTAPVGQMKYSANGTSFVRANSLASYLAYSASAGGHLNADGECEITNHFTP